MRSNLLRTVLQSLEPPVNVTATAFDDDRIDLSWTAVGGATGYDIDRDAAVIVTNQSATTYSDTGLTPSTLYTYRVRSRKWK
jgi:hypothetical protein